MLPKRQIIRLFETLWRVLYRAVWTKLPRGVRTVLQRVFIVALLCVLAYQFLPGIFSEVDLPFANARESSLQTKGTSQTQTQMRDLVVCSQNLYRFSSKERTDKRKRAKQKQFLITRMKNAECDVVALQELMGSNREEALEVAIELAGALEERTGRAYRAFAARSKNSHTTNGFLVAEDAGSVEDVSSHWRERLPKLQPRGPSAHFTRGPFSIVLRRNNAPALALISFHFKSRHKSWKDHTRTDFEALRMQEAAGLRKIIRSLKREHGNDLGIIAMGDRNSGSQSAASDIIRGVRTLSDFDSARGCRLTEEEESDCTSAGAKGDLIDLFGFRQRENPSKYTKGSYRYRGKESIYDEIFVTPELVSQVRRPDGTLALGFRGQFRKGSDHKLVWARIR